MFPTVLVLYKSCVDIVVLPQVSNIYHLLDKSIVPLTLE